MNIYAIVNKSFVAFFPISASKSELVAFRKANPKLKHGKIVEVIQFNPKLIEFQKIYERATNQIVN